MTPPCTIPTDALAQALCLHLTDPQNGYGLSPRNLDEGAPEVQFQSTGKPAPQDFFTRITVQGRGDGQSSAPEVYQKVLQLAPTQPRLAAFLKGKLEIPWLPSTQQNISPDFKKLDTWMGKKIESIKKTLREKGLTPGTFPHTLAMGEALFELIVGSKGEIEGPEEKTILGKARVPRPETSLGLVIDGDLAQPEKSLGEIFRKRKASCLEFTIFFLWAAQKAGIEVVPISSYRDILGATQEHVMVGFKNPQTKKLEKVADIGYPYFGDPDGREVLGEVPVAELWAEWFNAQGWQGMDAGRIEAYIDQALQMSPNHFLFLYNKGVCRGDAQDYVAAKRYFLASIRANPNYPNSYRNLYLIGKDLDDAKLAQWANKRFFSLPENSDKPEDFLETLLKTDQ